MKVLLAGAIACCGLVLLAGCGSSSAGSQAATGASVTGAATSTGAPRTEAGTTSASGGRLKLDSTPKFARPSPSQALQSGLVQIAYRDVTIEPDTVRVELGSTVRWTNYDSTLANVTSLSGPQRIASKDFGEGATFEVKLRAPGLIRYVCTLYPTTMNGTIEVVR